MKKIIGCSILLIAILDSCQKAGNSSSTVSTPKPTPVISVPAPTASFKINNTIVVTGVQGDAIKEGTPLAIQNISQNGYTYSWDFGNGNTSTEKEPSNAYLYPCMQNHTVTLTVTNPDGVTATASQTFYVACYRSFSGRINGTMPANWPQH